MRCLEKDRSRRYESANALANDVERYLSNEPVLARPPSPLYRVRKFTQRNRLLVASVAAILIALLTGLSVATYGLLKAEQTIGALTEEQENNQLMLQLFRDMYGIPWGMEAYGHQHTMRASVDELSDGLEERLRGHPQVEVEIRQIFASLYRNTGDLEKARDHLRIALERALIVHGPDHEKVADILTDLAAEIDARNNTMDYTEARALSERALLTYERIGIETGRTSHAWLCKARSMQADPALLSETDRCLYEALRIARDISHGKDTPKQVFALWDLATHLARTSRPDDRVRLDKAAGLIEESVAMSRAFPDQRTLTATVLSGQGECFRLRGESEAAVASYEEAWDIYRQRDLQNEPRGHRAAMDLAEIHFVTSQHRLGHKLLKELELLCREHEAWESLTECLYLQGWGHLIREDYPSAYECLSEAVGIAEKLPETSEVAAFSHFYMAQLLVAQHKLPESQIHFQAVLSQTQQFFPVSGAEFEIILFAHAWSLMHCKSSDDQGKLSEALRVAKRGKELSTAWHRTWKEPHFFLAMALAQEKLGDENLAVKLLEEGLTRSTTPFPSLHAYHYMVPTARRELEAALARLYLNRGDTENARRVYEEGVEAREQHFPLNHLQVALAELRLGKFLSEQGELEEAKPLLRSVQSKLVSNPEAADANRIHVAQQLELMK